MSTCCHSFLHKCDAMNLKIWDDHIQLSWRKCCRWGSQPGTAFVLHSRNAWRITPWSESITGSRSWNIKWWCQLRKSCCYSEMLVGILSNSSLGLIRHVHQPLCVVFWISIYPCSLEPVVASWLKLVKHETCCTWEFGDWGNFQTHAVAMLIERDGFSVMNRDRHEYLPTWFNSLCHTSQLWA